MEDLVVKFNEFTKKKYYPTYSIRQKFYEETKVFKPHYRLSIELNESNISNFIVLTGELHIPFDNEKPLIKLEWLIEKDMDTVKKQTTFMEKKLMTIALRLSDPEDEEIEEQEAQRIQTEQNTDQEPDKYTKARNGILVIMNKTGISEDETRREILEKMVGNGRLSSFTQKEINEFYKQIGNMIGKDKFKVSDITEAEFAIIKSYFADIIGG